MLKPILFKPEMVRAILDGRKTQTRRILKEQPPETIDPESLINGEVRPFKNRFCTGDVLWVREKWHRNVDNSYSFKADLRPQENVPLRWWKPSIHMPYKACRLWLEVTDVRVDRLHDMSDSDIVAEGIPYEPNEFNLMAKWINLWNRVSPKNGWHSNPYVEVVEFKIKEVKQ